LRLQEYFSSTFPFRIWRHPIYIDPLPEVWQRVPDFL
jgi:hypothetical protein